MRNSADTATAAQLAMALGLPDASRSPISPAFQRLRSRGVPDTSREVRMVRGSSRSEAVTGARP